MGDPHLPRDSDESAKISNATITAGQLGEYDPFKDPGPARRKFHAALGLAFVAGVIVGGVLTVLVALIYLAIAAP